MSWPREYDMEAVHNMMHFSPTCSYMGDNKLHVIMLRHTILEVLKESSSFIKSVYSLNITRSKVDFPLKWLWIFIFLPWQNVTSRAVVRTAESGVIWG